MSKARQLADLGNQVDDGAITGTNMVVNGGMTISQRGTSFVSPASGDYLLDRVVYQHSGTTARITSTQESDGVVGVSPKSFKAQITTAANASPSANCFTQFVYYFEGNDVDHLGLGTSSCKPITLSFYIKCSTTGTLPIGVSNGGTRSFPATYNVTEANVWQRHIIKIPAVTDGSWGSGINRGLELRLGLEYGSDYTGGTANEWNSIVGFANFTTTYTNPVASTLNATWQITGVCLNVGDSAIDFPHESYGDTLAKCQRYYQVGAFNGNAGTDLGDTNPTVSWMPVTAMRASATMSMRNDSAISNRYIDSAGNSVSWLYGGISHRADNTSYTGSYTNSIDTGMFVLDIGSASVGAASWIRFFWQADAEL